MQTTVTPTNKSINLSVSARSSDETLEASNSTPAKRHTDHDSSTPDQGMKAPQWMKHTLQPLHHTAGKEGLERLTMGRLYGCLQAEPMRPRGDNRRWRGVWRTNPRGDVTVFGMGGMSWRQRLRTGRSSDLSITRSPPQSMPCFMVNAWEEL